VIKNEGIENFYANPHGIIRDAFLGKKDDETGEREGRFFAENEMRVYEVEVLQVKIGDSEIEQMLVRNQNNIVKQSLVMAQLERETKYENAKQELTIEKANAVLKTALNEIENQKQKTQEQLKLELARSEKEKAVAEVEKVIAALQEEVNDVRTDAQLARDKKELDQEHEEAQRDLALKLELIAKEVQAVKDKGSAISPQLIAALQALGDKQLAAALSENMSIWGHLGGKSVVEVFQNLFAGTKLEGVKDLLMKDYVED
jgi:major vault protein